MMVQRLLLVNILASLLLLILASCVDAFSLGPPSAAVIASSQASSSITTTSSTCLFAQDESSAAESSGENEGVDDETTPPPPNKETKPPSAPVTDDILNSPAFLQRKLEVLQADIEKAEEALDEATKLVEVGKAEWASQLEDLQKEYQNIQERMNSQSRKGNAMATVQVAREMLKFMDTTDRAFGAIQTSTEEEQAIEAEYKAAYNQILETFQKLEIEVIETVGKEFDYEVHQAVMQKPSDEYDEGIVCEELQKGFKLGDTLIRASMVVVAA